MSKNAHDSGPVVAREMRLGHLLGLLVDVGQEASNRYPCLDSV